VPKEGENFFEKKTDNPPSSNILLLIIRSFPSLFLFGKKTDNSPSSIILQIYPSFPLPSKSPQPLQRKIKGREVGKFFSLLLFLLLVEVGDVEPCVQHKIGHRHVGQLGPELGQHGVLLFHDGRVDLLQPQSSLHAVAAGTGRVVRPVEPIHKK